MPTRHSKICSRPLLSGLLAACCAAVFAPAHASEQSRIQNGVAAADGAYPWLVSIGTGSVNDPKAAHYCGGSLLSDRWVLTAAHCFTASTVATDQAVVVGRNLLTDTNAGQRIAASRILRHPDYNDSTKDNDIALVELSAPVINPITVKFAATVTPLTEGIVARSAGRGSLAAPLNYLMATYNLSTNCNTDLEGCLSEAINKKIDAKSIVQTLLLANGLKDPTKGIGYAELVAYANARGVAASTSMSFDALYDALQQAGVSLTQAAYIVALAASGSNEIREVDLPLSSTAACKAAYGDGITANMFCAGYADQPKDTCQGDSGGPLFIRNPQNTDWIQVGIVSFGGVCGTGIGVYAKLANYLDWINQYVPHFTEERLINWAEAAVGSLLKPTGSERSMGASQGNVTYWGRCYGQSGTCVGSVNQDAAFFDGTQINNLGSLNTWITEARKAGY